MMSWASTRTEKRHEQNQTPASIQAGGWYTSDEREPLPAAADSASVALAVG